MWVKSILNQENLIQHVGGFIKLIRKINALYIKDILNTKVSKNKVVNGLAVMKLIILLFHVNKRSMRLHFGLMRKQNYFITKNLKQ